MRKAADTERAVYARHEASQRNSLPIKRADHLPARRRKSRFITRPFKTASMSPSERALAYKIVRSLVIVMSSSCRIDLG